MPTTQTIIHGKMRPVLRKQFPDNHFDSCVTDPPYGYKFMGKKWDYKIPPVADWREVWRVLKPGAHMLVACGTRTQHRMACNIEDAGFEIRDIITWHYGSGFPKSLDIGKAIDKTPKPPKGGFSYSPLGDGGWSGYGTALKPATELWTLARKPLDGTVANNVLMHGVGGLNIDACRIAFKDPDDKDSATWGRGTDILGGNFVGGTHGSGKTDIEANPLGRWPANVIFDEFTGKILDEQAPQTGAYAPIRSGQLSNKTKNAFGVFGHNGDDGRTFHDDGVLGGASRFFYCPKADKFERDKGLHEYALQHGGIKNDSGRGYSGHSDPYEKIMRRNDHPTVKPIGLMRYLVKLITPKGGIVLDQYNGVGSTGIAAKLELMNYVGIDMKLNYCKISKARIAAWNPERYKEQTLF